MSSQKSSFADVKTVGIDIGKTTFQLIGKDGRGTIVLRAKLTRAQLMLRFSNAKRCVMRNRDAADLIVSFPKVSVRMSRPIRLEQALFSERALVLFASRQIFNHVFGRI